MPVLWPLPPPLRFIAVGCAAAAVHLGAVVLLVSELRLTPLIANVLGWLTAFGVSFVGHHRWTFAHLGARWHRALPRFLTLSALGFAINQGTYALALRSLPWRYDVLLAGVLVLVAVATYVLGKLWAFGGQGN